MTEPILDEIQPFEGLQAPYDQVDEEPDLDIVLRTRRRLDPKGNPASLWEYAHAVEGVWKAPMSQTQRNYAAAMLRHISFLVQEPIPEGESKAIRSARIAKRFRTEIKVLMDAYVNLAAHLAIHYGGTISAASLLGIKERELIHMLKSRFPKALEEQPRTPRVKREPALKVIAREIVASKAVG